MHLIIDFLLMKVLFVISTLLINCEWNSADVPSYFDAGYGKCDGMFSGEIGTIQLNTSSSDFIGEISTKSKDKCRWQCSREIRDCWMIEYLEASCRLYTKIAFVVKGKDSFEFWKCAQPTWNKFIGRCLGYLVGYDNFSTVSESHFPIAVYYNISFLDCQNNCLSHSMCGTFNCNTKSDVNIVRKCTLLYGYLPILKDNYTSTPDSHSVTIRCSNKIEDYLRPISDKRETQNGLTIQTGKWKLVRENYNFSLFEKVIFEQFQIMYFESCVKSCSKNPFCLNPIYVTGFTPICVMALDPKIGNFKMDVDIKALMNKSEYYFWEWATHTTQSKSRVILNNNSTCFCLSRSGKFHIKEEGCLYYKTLDINGTISLYMERTLSLNNSFLMNDGYRRFHVTVNDDKEMKNCEEDLCRIYSELSNSNKSIKFVNREEWFPLSPFQRDNLTLPVEYVVILNTYKPDGRCFSKASCSAFVRDYQIFHLNVSKFSDIAYNFLIGEDGRIYEGRGWTYGGAHTKGVNMKSIGVAFIGWFETVYPNTKALVALRNLIQFGVKNNLIKPTFLLSTNRDIRGSDNPGVKLSKIISSWKFTDLSNIEHCSNSNTKKGIGIYFLGLGSLVFCIFIISIPVYLNRLHQLKPCRMVKIGLTGTDMKTGWYFDNDYEMKMEKLNLKVDWIYVCEENKQERNNVCQCLSNFRTLWWYCSLNPDTNFMYKFSSLHRMLNCVKPIHLFVAKSTVIANSRNFVFFHMKKRNLPRTKSFLIKAISSKLCLCRRFTVTRFPEINHEDLTKSVPKLLETSVAKSTVNLTICAESTISLKSC